MSVGPCPSLMEEIKRREAQFRQLEKSSRELHLKLSQLNALHRVYAVAPSPALTPPPPLKGGEMEGAEEEEVEEETPASSCSEQSIAPVELKAAYALRGLPSDDAEGRGPSGRDGESPQAALAAGVGVLSSSPSPSSSSAAASREDEDAVVEFMAKQLEALLAEKARLAEDNARLLRENSSLHDILSISMSFDGGEAEDEDGCEEAIDLAGA
mmetsp:Transcript_40319/g.114149  ORF Transcript_40319/g.114149 Transcript_40319/m.114149 type:complete len:212 (-) Transcript_40319:17-652(-)|eukprot:CAMPEP_0117693724 /NCGR_PEP_ID=MMETSP0804-20121206/27040_1 /TAXON_ID=1074897 /ORGANISM="Tetraselmis astigmatica, Strain CCMP880" /LENGTH=211 /DNA_ID=CAMNT_0005507311 /DNA_START=600 /DNA_END=1235 /DNA_ORIENTATION=-